MKNVSNLKYKYALLPFYNIAIYSRLITQMNRNKFKSNYQHTFGDKADLSDLTDPEILKTQKFSKIPCACVLNELTLEILGRINFE